MVNLPPTVTVLQSMDAEKGSGDPKWRAFTDHPSKPEDRSNKDELLQLSWECLIRRIKYAQKSLPRSVTRLSPYYLLVKLSSRLSGLRLSEVGF